MDVGFLYKKEELKPLKFRWKENHLLFEDFYGNLLKFIGDVLEYIKPLLKSDLEN